MNETPEPPADQRKSPGLVAACVVFTCGLLVWVAAVPMVAREQLVLHAPLTDEAGLVALAMVPYSSLSGLGALLVRSALGKQHLASQLAISTYLVLLGVGLLAAVVVNSG